jgi:predicted TIM-barrel enzyme
MNVSSRKSILFLLNHLVPAKASNPTTEMDVSLIVNNQEHLLIVLADTGANSTIILEAYNSVPFIKTNDSNTTTWRE